MRRKIESEEVFLQAMTAVQSSVELLDIYDWDDWLQKEQFFKTAGTLIDPHVYESMQNDEQFELKVAVIKAAALYMKTIRELRR